MNKRSRRLIAVSLMIALVMIACVKLSGTVRKPSNLRFSLDEAASVETHSDSTPPPSDGNGQEEEIDISPEKGQPGHGDEVGSWEKSWSAGEWVEWIVPGPTLTIIATIFIAYLYGPIWAIGTFVVLAGIDCFAFYFNI